MTVVTSIPRLLVRTNQWVIILAVLLTWITHENWLLAIPLLAGGLGLVFNWNPIMRFARIFLRKRPSEYDQEDLQQQQFNQVIAVICLLIGMLAFQLHLVVMGYLFSALVALAAFVATMGFCVGCFIRFQWQQFCYRRSV